jgi:hypothetical protein
MAGSLLSVRAHTVHTRVIRRADTRATTEPRPRRAATVTEVDTTAPYRKDFEPTRAGRESLPYAELLVSESDGPSVDTRDTTLPRPERDISEDKTLEKRRPELDDTTSDTFETIEQPKVDLDAILRELKPPVLANGSGAVAAIEAEAEDEDEDEDDAKLPTTRPAHLSFLGIATSPPQVGACLVIGARSRKDFCVTSPVTHVFPRGDGTLVQTATKSRYFVEPGGDAYLVRKSE